MQNKNLIHIVGPYYCEVDNLNITMYKEREVLKRDKTKAVEIKCMNLFVGTLLEVARIIEEDTFTQLDTTYIKDFHELRGAYVQCIEPIVKDAGVETPREVRHEEKD